MAVGWIYKIVCLVDGKVYVGQTRKSVAGRFKQHIAKAMRDDFSHLSAAIRAHGVDNFVIEVIEEVEVDLLSESEVAWIEKLDSRNRVVGYNVARGGNAPPAMIGDDVRRKISETLKGHVHSEETKAKISEAIKGSTLSEETRKKISESLNRPECVERRRAAMLGKQHALETKTAMSKKSIEMWQDPDFHRTMCESRRGSKNSRAILDEDKVRQIRIAFRDVDRETRGNLKKFLVEHARLSGASEAVVFRVVMGHSWKHVLIDDT